MTPEFMGLLVLGLMQLGNFWFNASKNRREEEGVKRAELKEVEVRLEGKIAALERRVERKTDQLREEIRQDFQNVFEQLKTLNTTTAGVSSSSSHLAQRMAAMETKIDVLANKLK